MTENTTTEEQSRVAADCPNERIVRYLRAMAKTMAANDDFGINNRRVEVLEEAANMLEQEHKKILGYRDMLREASKQLRSMGATAHAAMCDTHLNT